MKNILVSWPMKERRVTFVPYIWGILKTVVEQEGDLKDKFNWLDPIFEREPIQYYIGLYKDQQVDILCLSCYLWNTESNYEIARRFKKINPDCFVIAGGPGVAHKNPNYFDEKPVDVVIRYAGETAFVKVLRAHLNGTSMTDIGGLMLPDYGYTDGFEPTTDLSVSPYECQYNDFKRFADYIKGKDTTLRAILETNRGCPYSCYFCTQNNKNNLTKVPIDRVKKEIDIVSSVGITSVFNMDCNFGVFDRDGEILDYVINTRKETGYPKTYMFHVAKNAVDRNIEFAIRCHDEGLMTHHCIGMQHTDPEVLETMNRKNPTLSEQARTVLELHRVAIPSSCQLIVGMPSDTVDKWQTMFYDLMRMQIDEVFIYKLIVLENSLLSEKEFMAEWQVLTKTKLIDPEKKLDIDSIRKDFLVDVVIGTKSYTTEDWKDMYIWSAYMQAIHFGDITKNISQYLYTSYQIDYKEFYELLYDYFIKTELYQNCYEHISRYIEDANLIEEMEIEKFGSAHRMDDYIQIHYLLDNQDELFEIIRNTYKGISHIEDLIKFQRDIVITSEYDRREGTTIENHVDFKSYFMALAKHEQPPELTIGNFKWNTKQQKCGVLKGYDLNWHEISSSPKSIMKSYIQRVVGFEYTKPERVQFNMEEMDEIN